MKQRDLELLDELLSRWVDENGESDAAFCAKNVRREIASELPKIQNVWKIALDKHPSVGVVPRFSFLAFKVYSNGTRVLWDRSDIFVDTSVGELVGTVLADQLAIELEGDIRGLGQ